MDIAELNGCALRRLLSSADRLRERAMLFGSSLAKTPLARSSALLVSMTCRLQRPGCFCLPAMRILAPEWYEGFYTIDNVRPRGDVRRGNPLRNWAMPCACHLL